MSRSARESDLGYRPLRIADLPRGLQPREEDIELTRKLIEAGKLLNIPVYDHVVVGRPTEEHLGFFSIAASGLVKFD